MANTSIYLDALLTFDRPATVREVHDKALEMFGKNVRGDRTSARISLERYLNTGKVTKDRNKYFATNEAADPIGALATKNKMLEAKVSHLEAENKRLWEQISAAQK